MRSLASRWGTFALIMLLTVSLAPSVLAEEKPLVIASIPSLAEIVKEAFGDSVRVEILVPLGVDPHEYQLSPEQVEKAQSALVIVTTGGHLPAEKKLRELSEKGEISAKVLGIEDYQKEGFRFVEKSWMGGSNEHGTWMDPNNALAIAKATKEALIESDPRNKDVYEREYGVFEERVRTIVEAYKVIFENMGKKKAIIELPAHQYALNWLGVKVVDAIKPEEEAPAKSVDVLLSAVEDVDFIVYSKNSPDPLKNAAMELSQRSGRPLANIVYMWTNEEYTKVLEENTAEILKALSSQESQPKTVELKQGVSEIYVLLAMIIGIVLGFAVGMFIKE
ncbi:hypothetical protein PAP_06580 [Palaeococcus pacificus DY20341]|uniref:ABC transporter substrate-binding protein n=1 Tax=Palaeococcus pacificus DY20341 TaxID=1343739 RepID=A0A075LYR3_9EURY|nr:zinc ABC transporter substrate-binding protein [Palaeococcus pacificus]AIF69713.1 hypothetical protein PAP_06580 [Palaeococcus pacificus DY20341]